jgi:myo-inositol-1(or 4)-monophosphatase
MGAVTDLLEEMAASADVAYRLAMRTLSRSERSMDIGLGGDGTPTMHLDRIIEAPVLEVLERAGVNVLSEEVGWVDRGSAITAVIDPVDGTANSAAGVPISAFAAAIAVDGRIVECLSLWLGTTKRWHSRHDDPVRRTVTDRTSLEGAEMCMLRPRPETWASWSAVASSVARVRVLGSSVIEAGLVADGAVDAFCDPGGDVHRIVDLAPMSLVIEKAGGVMRDLHGRPFTLEPDLTLRWSGVVAASQALADGIIETVLGGTK